MRGQHPQRRDQDPLGLLLPHRAATPAHAERPFAHTPLQADDMLDARARRARDPAQRLHGLLSLFLTMIYRLAVAPVPRVALGLFFQ